MIVLPPPPNQISYTYILYAVASDRKMNKKDQITNCKYKEKPENIRNKENFRVTNIILIIPIALFRFSLRACIIILIIDKNYPFHIFILVIPPMIKETFYP